MGYGVVCQGCGIEAPAKQVQFYQNIGALVMRFHRRVNGQLCKRCVHSNYWKMTGITATIGWFGLISIIVSPIFIIMNTVNYLGALGMPDVPADAKRPELNEEIAGRIRPRVQEIFGRMNQKEPIADIAREIAPQVGVTPGQIAAYVAFVIHSQRQTMVQQQRTGGFPVVPTGGAATRGATPPPLPGN